MKKGFTILELMVVISLLSLLISISSVNLAGLKRCVLLDNSANELANTLNIIKQTAISSSGRTGLICNVKKYYVEKLDLFSNSMKKSREASLPDGICFKEPCEISFSQSGFPIPGYSGTITMSDRSGRTKKIIVSSFGRIRIE